MDWNTTSTILDGLREGPGNYAWQRLCSRFRPPVVAFARDMGLSFADAEDVAQETLAAFAEAYRRGRYDRTRGRLSHWLFGFAYRHAAHARHRLARDGQARAPGALDRVDEARLIDEAEATLSWDRRWEEALLEQCLQRVAQEVEPETFRAFHLVVVLNRPPADAAEVLAVPIKMVYNAKHRVLKRIRELRAEYESVLEESGPLRGGDGP